jgi:hypothetical protein
MSALMLKRLMVLLFAVPLATAACVSNGTTRPSRTAGTTNELPGRDKLDAVSSSGGIDKSAPHPTQNF